MGGAEHQILEGFLAKTAHQQVGRRRYVIGRRTAAGTAHEIGRQKQAHHLPSAILHRLGQGCDAGNNRGHEIHPVA